MTQKLSHMFFGNKKFKENHYKKFQSTKSINEDQVEAIFQPYSAMLKSQMAEDGSCSQFSIFAQFIDSNLKKFHDWQFQKLSSWIELSAHVFEYSLENCLSKKQSVEYFNQVLVRHSLFRPPHSINIFSYEQCKKASDFWLGTFVRFYEEYSCACAPEINEIVQTRCSPFPQYEIPLKQGKQIDRQKLGQKMIQQLGVTLKKVNKEEASE